MKKIAVFASGSGTNFQAICDAIQHGKLDAEITLLVCDKPEAKVIERAKQVGIESFVFSPKSYPSKAFFELEIVEKLQEKQVELIALAGYMRLIGETLLGAFKNKIINIHPSLLPLFPGKDAIGQAYRAGVSRTGITIHFVDEGMDTGPIIAQKELAIEKNETLESIEHRIHKIEHEFYPQVLQSFIKGRNDRGN
ncbi:phosphoribosylglycinamide formyltransferase [Fredinandcohnia quinoae]|uniref:Phosphoribosylglycinamide formyltransferase n=1 Tax=Fredinandcohnia quinoae TaxID=2918902 RepID=A0AAW5DVL0_9BACI|nr:phosphoribosylglycinamide formyltransferase [Fredinandcohnia sp. SECRCQ15]MCH1624676.1 phosphoribosylglycinamide formyltransferase [Fredinandcohnia sp. SECRCQ15]